MIRIYADDLNRIELHVHGEDVEIVSIGNRLGATETIAAASPSPAGRRRIGVIAAAVLVAIGAAGGYFVAPRHSGADAAAFPEPGPVPRAEALPATPPGVPPLVQRELLGPPRVTPAPPAPPSAPSGPDAFGLQR